MEQLAYLTGFFDGEGCVSVSANGSIDLRITACHYKTLKMFESYFGGRVSPRKQKTNKPQYVWTIFGPSALEAAIKLSKFSVEKLSQLLLAIDWMHERYLYPRQRRISGRGHAAHPERKIRIKEYQQKLTEMKLA